MERPNRCYIRQEWFEAVSFLSPGDRCEFYEALMSFVYYGRQRDTLSPVVRGLLEMAKPTLSKDIQSYSQKVVANRQNGALGGRPRGDITQENPKEPNPTQRGTNTLIHKLIQKTVSTEPISERKRDILILIELFACGYYDPEQEARKMIDYYSARGWVDKGGNPIVDVAALARVWKGEGKSKYFANVRKKWAAFCKSLGESFEDVLVTAFSRMERKEIGGNPCAVIYCTDKELMNVLESNHLEALRAAMLSWSVQGINYVIQSPERAKEEVLQPFEAV